MTWLASPGLAEVLAAIPEARLVGGAVRDALAGLPVADIDLATPDPPEQIMRALTQAGLRALPTGLAHGTVTAISAGKPFEITTLRRDQATDGRHATVAWTDDWQQDAARRDFTINAMSMDRNGQVFDYFDGRADLAAGRVRFVGDAARRVAEDYLRILRFFRFHARYGRGDPDPQATDAIRAGLPGLGILSVERIWSEMKRILGTADPSVAIRLMDRLGVLAAVIPEGTDAEALAALVQSGAPAEPLLRLAALLTGNAATVAERLKFSGAETVLLAGMRTAPVPDPADDDATLRRYLADEAADMLIARTWLTGGARQGWADLRHRLGVMPRPQFPLEGRDALALGAEPGPEIGAALRATRDWWRQTGCTKDAGSCRAYLLKALALPTDT